MGSAFVCSTWKDHYNCHPTKVCSIFLTVNYLSNCLSQHSWGCLKIQERKDKVGVGIILHCSSVWFTLRFSRCCKGSKFILRSIFWWDAQKKWNTAWAELLIYKWGNSTSTCFFSPTERVVLKRECVPDSSKLGPEQLAYQANHLCLSALSYCFLQERNPIAITDTV